MYGICRVGLQDPCLIQVSLGPWLGSEGGAVVVADERDTERGWKDARVKAGVNVCT